MTRPTGMPKTGGRIAGTPNKSTAEIKALAQEYGPAAIAELARIMTKGETEATRLAAARELLDRGFGKSAQAITGADGEPLVMEPRVVKFVVVDPNDRQQPDARF